MNPLVKAIATCPRCHGALDWPADGSGPVCQACGRRYHRVQGVPLLRLDAAGEPLAPTPPAAAGSTGWRRALSRRTTPPDVAYKTVASRERIPRFVAGLGPEVVSLNLGSGRTNFGPRVVNLDIGPFPHVDVVAGGERLPLRDACLDGVITQGVLEHVPELPATLAEIDRVLRPGGQVYHEVPFVQGYHGSPGDFRRFTIQGLQELVPGYRVLDQGVAVGPSSALMWIASEWLALLFSLGNDRLHRIGRRLFAWLLSPLKQADAWLERHPRADLVASAFYVVACKPEGEP